MNDGRPGLTPWSVRWASEGLDEKNIKDNLERLAKDLNGYDVFKYNFSDNLYDDFTIENKGLKTDFPKALSQIKSMFINKNLSLIVLASDGLNNTGINPIYSDNLNVPIQRINFINSLNNL